MHTVTLGNVMWWICLPLGAIVLGALFSPQSPRWLRSLLMFGASVAGSIVLLTSLTATLHARRLSDAQNHSPVKYESYVARPARGR